MSHHERSGLASAATGQTHADATLGRSCLPAERNSHLAGYLGDLPVPAAAMLVAAPAACCACVLIVL